jgi:hypothetical protein
MLRRVVPLMVAILSCVGSVFVAGSLVATPTAFADGDYGPDTCLQGWVWRDARQGDHVCVTGATRSQVADDNAQAANRREANGGPFGPDTCKQGYVWREAFPGDHVCVTGATRSQAADDNAQAANRRASLKIWLTKYSAEERVCDGDVCSTNNDTAPRIKVNGDHFNVNSQVKIVARRSGNNTGIRTYTVTASTHQGFVGGSFGELTGLLADCTGPNNAYFQAYDFVSQRWSERLPFTYGCATL